MTPPRIRLSKDGAGRFALGRHHGIPRLCSIYRGPRERTRREDRKVYGRDRQELEGRGQEHVQGRHVAREDHGPEGRGRDPEVRRVLSEDRQERRSRRRGREQGCHGNAGARGRSGPWRCRCRGRRREPHCDRRRGRELRGADGELQRGHALWNEIRGGLRGGRERNVRLRRTHRAHDGRQADGSGRDDHQVHAARFLGRPGREDGSGNGRRGAHPRRQRRRALARDEHDARRPRPRREGDEAPRARARRRRPRDGTLHGEPRQVARHQGR